MHPADKKMIWLCELHIKANDIKPKQKQVCNVCLLDKEHTKFYTRLDTRCISCKKKIQQNKKKKNSNYSDAISRYFKEKTDDNS